MKPAAVFDIDGTVLPWPSTELRFLIYLTRHRVLTPGNLVRRLTHWGRQAIDNRSWVSADRTYLAGLPVVRVQENVDGFFQGSIVPDLRGQAIDRLRAHASMGHLIVLLSGTLDFLLMPFQILLRAPVGIGTRLEEMDGAFTGRLAGRNVSGKEKARWLAELQKAYNIDLKCSYGYGNHHSDRYFLQMVGHPTAVHPDRKLKAHARAEHWAIEEWNG